MQQAIIVKKVEEVRASMPRIGGRKLYYLIKDPLLEHGIDIGRDKLFDVMAEHGLLVKRKKRRKPITTNSDHPFYKYPNLVKDIEITYPNQVWVSDITYISLTGGYCYLSLVTDAYSRKIIGHCLWRDLSRQGPLNALRMALENSELKNERLVHHSDRGLQYCCREYIQLLEDKKISVSMTSNGDPYENAQAERVNGILKSEFNLDKGYKSFDDAQQAVDSSIKIYNSSRPHASCNYLTPNEAFKMTDTLKKRWKHYQKNHSNTKIVNLNQDQEITV